MSCVWNWQRVICDFRPAETVAAGAPCEAVAFYMAQQPPDLRAIQHPVCFDPSDPDAQRAIVAILRGPITSEKLSMVLT